MMDRLSDNRSLGELFSDLTRETATLIRQEVALARAELTQSLERLGRHAAMIAGGGAIAYAGLLSLVAALVLLLVRAGLAPWLAALLGGIVVLAIGALMIQQGLAALRRDRLSPKHTIESMKENATWAKHHLG